MKIQGYLNNMNILCYHIQNDTIFNSDGEYCKEDYIEWLLRSKRDTIRVFYHLDYFVARLLKLIGITKESAIELFENGDCKFNEYVFKYIDGKFFSIEKGRYWQNWSDISQYIDNCELAENDDAQVLADYGKDIGEQVYDALTDLGLRPTSLTSPLRAYEKDVLSKMDLQKEEELPTPVGKYAYSCKHGAWVEAYKIGHFDETWDYDIKSCYAFFTSKLIDPRLGKWERSRSYNSKAHYGYGLTKVEIDSDFSPIVIDGVENDFTPCGDSDLFLSKKEVDFINENDIGKATILDFVWFTPDMLKYPFKKLINDLYGLKEKATGLNREIIKRCSSTIWGKMLEFKQKGTKFGQMFNSVLGIDVEVSARLEVARFVIEMQKKGYELLHIAVDGVLLAGSHTSTTSLSNNGAMGSWALTAHSPAFVVGSGCVAIKETQKDNPFSLRYDWLMSEIQKNPDSRVYTMEKIMPMTLGKALVKDKDGNDDFDKLGELIKSERRLEVDFEMKREYGDLPTCGRDLLENKYDSIPRDMVQASIL